MNSFMALRILYAGCLVITAIIGFRFGGRSEKAGVSIVLAASIATVIVENPLLFDWSSNRAGLVAVDILALVAFLHLALMSQRFWPLWATSFHLIAVCSHCVILLSPSRVLQIYAILQGFWAYPIMVVIILGALSHQPRRAAVTTA